MSDFTTRMEAQALGIRDLRDGMISRRYEHFSYNDEIAPWYNPACLFKPGTRRVLIAPRPFGFGYRPPMPYVPDDHDCKAMGCDERVMNELIDYSWGCRAPGHDLRQIYARLLFVELYGIDGWEATLRGTPCFNLYPIRDYDLNELPGEVWDATIEWCKEVLDHLRPKTIICIGTDGRRTPWTALDRMLGLRQVGSRPISGSLVIKTATVYRSSLFAAEVIAFPDTTSYALMNELANDLGTGTVPPYIPDELMASLTRPSRRPARQ